MEVTNLSGNRYPQAGDPILAAGRIVCGSCRRESFPLAAEWVDDTLILVTFEQNHSPACSRQSDCGTVLVDLDADEPEVPYVPRPRMCRGVVRSSSQAVRPCKRLAGRGSAYCVIHDPARQVIR